MIDELRSNIQTEIRIVREMSDFVSRAEISSATEKRLIESMVDSYKRRIKMINDSIPEILDNISLIPKIGDEKKSNIYNFEVGKNPQSKVNSRSNDKIRVALRSEDKKKFLEELSISEDIINKIKKTGVVKDGKLKDYKKPQGYAKLSNSIFRSFSESLLDKGGFQNLRRDLRQSNLNILPTTYVSMSFFGTLIAIIAGILVMLFFLFFSISSSYPFISAYNGGFFQRFVRVIWIALLSPVLTFFIFYFYPYTEKKSLGGRIDREIPFVAIHMASVSGSGIEPTQIFKIIGTSKEYPYTGGELRKLLNQLNVYGYDLVTALKNISKSTPSLKLSELLKGLATSIMTGGDLQAFLEKRAETLLLNYRLEREKFAKTAETFMDIYISVVIAAPMILLLLLVMISVSGISVGFSTNALTLGIILIVAVVNILFLVLLGMKQPGY